MDITGRTLEMKRLTKQERVERKQMTTKTNDNVQQALPTMYGTQAYKVHTS